MTGSELRAQVRAIMERTSLTYYMVASASGVSPSTTRFLLKMAEGEELRGDAHAKLEAFIRKNAAAMARGEVRFV